MKSDSDAAKLDELKRLLRRLDKALPQSPADDAPAPGARDRSAQAGASGQGNGTALRTIALASGVSLIVSFAVATLIFHDTTIRQLVAMKAPDTIPQPPAQRDEPLPREQAAPSVDTATLEAEPPQLEAAPLATQQASSDAPTGPLPPAPSPAAAVQETNISPPPMETGGVDDAPSSVAAVVSPPVASEAPAPPAAKPDVAMPQPETRHAALVELDAEQFLRRGLLMLSGGSVSAAQLLLERAADLGNGDAAFALATTYDGAPGAPRHGDETRPNAGLALRWYARAEELGVAEARKRLTELKSGEATSGR